MSLQLSGLNPLAYKGVEASQPPQLVYLKRRPTTNDYQNFNIGTLWLAELLGIQEVWMLVSLVAGSALWVRIYPQGGGSSITFVGNTGNATEAGGLLNVIGISDANNNTGVRSNAFGNSVEFEATPITHPTDSGTATPANDQLSIVGDNIVTTTGASDTVTVKLSRGTDGQVPIAGTGIDPIWANITSSDATVTITNGPNSIDLSASAAGAAESFSVVLTTPVTIITPISNAALEYQVVCDTAVYDPSNSYDLGTGVFTAPSTGLWLLNFNIVTAAEFNSFSMVNPPIWGFVGIIKTPTANYMGTTSSPYSAKSGLGSMQEMGFYLNSGLPAAQLNAYGAFTTVMVPLNQNDTVSFYLATSFGFAGGTAYILGQKSTTLSQVYTTSISGTKL